MFKSSSPRLTALVSLTLFSASVLPAHAYQQVDDSLRADAEAELSGAENPEAADVTPPLEPSAASDRNVYQASYFEAYVPRTALDMVRRIPGFQIRSGDTGRRGLGQGGANVLINGERLTGKTDPFNELDQLLASSVVEIRVLEGATLSIPGLSGQVVDIIVSRPDGLKGTWEWNPQFRKRLEPSLLNAELNISGEADLAGGLTYTLQLREYGFRSGAIRDEQRSQIGGGPIEQRDEKISNFGDRPGIALNLSWTPAPEHKVNLNTEYFLFNFARTANAIRTPLRAQGDDSLTESTSSEDEWNLEIDGDYEFPLLSGQMKLTGVYDREHSPMSNSFALFDPQSGFAGASRFDQFGKELELIGRAEYSWSPTEGRDWQVAAEAAYNELDIEQQLFRQNPGAGFIGDPLSGFVVSEDRYEVTTTHSRPLNDKWDLQASIGLEYSKLMQDRAGGAAVDPRSFYRPKGFLSATYKVDDTFRIRSRIEREVGQLNFFDFVSSVDLVDNLGRSGNPDLVPAQSWLASLDFDKDFGQGNTFRIEVYGAQISDTVDRIPVGANGDAVGNIGTAYRYGFDIASTLKGERWGLPGTELNLIFDWRDSIVDDPVQDFSRRLNGDKEIYYEVSYRHDIPSTDWAYGAFMERFISARQYRLFSIDRIGVDKPYAAIFVEHKDVFGMTLNANLGNLFGQKEFFERTRFDGRRDVGVPSQIDNATFEFGPILRLSLSGSF